MKHIDKKTVLEDLKFLYSHADETLIYISTKYKNVNHLETLLYCLLERLRHISISIETLLEDYERYNAHEFTIGISLRCMMLDILIAVHILNESIKQTENKSDTVKRLEDLAVLFLTDGFKKTLDDVKEEITEPQELQDFYKQFIKNSHYFFQPYSTHSEPELIKKSVKFSPKYLRNQNRNGITKVFVANVYQLYLFYSKYDHISKFSLDFIRQPIEKKAERLYNAVDYMMVHSINLHSLLKSSYDNDIFLEAQLKTMYDLMSFTHRNPNN